MPTLTPELLGNSLIVMGISYVIVLCFQVYVLYLNWKQSKVKDLMIELNETVNKILKLMEKGK